MKTLRWIFYALWFLLMVAGALGVYLRVSEGLQPTALGSYIVWCALPILDIYFIGLSAGAFLLSSLVYVFRVKQLEPVGKLALFTALVCLFLAILSAWFDIGHMERFLSVFTRPNFHSLMTWIVWLYSAYFLLLLAELWFALRRDLAGWAAQQDRRAQLARLILLGRTGLDAQTVEGDRRLLRILGTIGVPLAIAFHGGMGALFATLLARSYWYGPLYPIFFLTGALASGSALLLAVTVFAWPRRDETWRAMITLLSRILVGLLALDLLLEWAEVSTRVWYGVGAEVQTFQTVLFGPYWWVFWVFHILLGILIPFALIAMGQHRPWRLGAAGALVATLFMAVRLNIVIPGLITSAFPGLQEAYQGPRLLFSYFPSLTEWQVALFVFMLGIGLFYLGYRLLPLVQAPKEIA
ncbi:MAG: polysulfide reductase NrfD [Chloroflexi bacterium]|nr:polysulfide reductase NrfD [Chloroflexota bacterium]